MSTKVNTSQVCPKIVTSGLLEALNVMHKYLAQDLRNSVLEVVLSIQNLKRKRIIMTVFLKFLELFWNL